MPQPQQRPRLPCLLLLRPRAVALTFRRPQLPHPRLLPKQLAAAPIDGVLALALALVVVADEGEHLQPQLLLLLSLPQTWK
jgi:hypothetical protein